MTKIDTPIPKSLIFERVMKILCWLNITFNNAYKCFQEFNIDCIVLLKILKAWNTTRHRLCVLYEWIHGLNIYVTPIFSMRNLFFGPITMQYSDIGFTTIHILVRLLKPHHPNYLSISLPCCEVLE